MHYGFNGTGHTIAICWYYFKKNLENNTGSDKDYVKKGK